MTKYLFLLLLFFPYYLFGQRVVTLSVEQLPEFGYSITKYDTTILKGNSVTLGSDLTIFGGSGEYTFSWSPVETLSNPNILQPKANPEDSTTYFLTVTDSYGCSFTISYKVNVQLYATGLDDLPKRENELTAILFPNPSDGNFKVKLTGLPTEKIILAIFDNNGKVLKSKTIRNFTGEQTETFQLNLVAGIYLLQLNAGAKSLSHQFIIK